MIRSRSNEERSGSTRARMGRLATTYITPKTAITVIKQNEKDAKDDKDDKDPQPAKRRKLPPIPTHYGLTPPYEHGPASRLGRPYSLTPSSTTQPKINKSPS
jgi:hypothetical protein